MPKSVLIEILDKIEVHKLNYKQAIETKKSQSFKSNFLSENLKHEVSSQQLDINIDLARKALDDSTNELISIVTKIAHQKDIPPKISELKTSELSEILKSIKTLIGSLLYNYSIILEELHYNTDIPKSLILLNERKFIEAAFDEIEDILLRSKV